MIERCYPKLPIPAVAALIFLEGQILMILRGNPPSVGKWSFPGGVQQVGETTVAAVQREVFEETGLVIYTPQLLDMGDVIVSDSQGRIEYHYVIAYFLVSNVAGSLSFGDDARAARWFNLDEALQLDLPAQSVELLSKASVLVGRPV
ncbi:MAG: NUDIX hydrolase [Anaerolineae bacterium]|nr:NUDIX hydrolase [Anaerolineae bacterium]